jgi:hypothetical protein
MRASVRYSSGCWLAYRFVTERSGQSRSVRSAVCVIACSLCLGAAACGGSEDVDADRAAPGTSNAATTTRSTVAAAEYARRADEVCRREIAGVLAARTQQRLKQIQATSAPDEQKLRRAAPILSQQLDLISAFRREIEALGLPDAHQEDARQIVAKARSAEDELERGVDAARAGDGPAFADAMQRYYGFSVQSASIARDSKLNFAVCGAGA